MGWKKWPFWLKAVITITLVFIISEIALRAFGYTGILSNNALEIISASLNRLLILLDNLILFIVVIFLPIILASKLLNKIPIPKYKYSITGKSLTKSTITLHVPQDLRHKAEGKGLIYGSIISALYVVIDFFFIKSQIPACVSFCGFENLFALASSLAYFFIGLFLFRNKIMENEKAK